MRLDCILFQETSALCFTIKDKGTNIRGLNKAELQIQQLNPGKSKHVDLQNLAKKGESLETTTSKTEFPTVLNLEKEQPASPDLRTLETCS